MNSEVFDKLNNFIFFLEDDTEWDNYGLDGLDMLDSYLADFCLELKSNIFGKTDIEKIDVVSEYVFKIYKNLLIVEISKADVTNNGNSFINKFLSETYNDLIDAIIHISFSVGIDFKEIVLKLKISESFFNLETYYKLNIFLFGTENRNSTDVSNLYIFDNPISYDLFIHFYELHKNKKYYLAEISYIYRVMYDEGNIKSFCRPEIFREWLIRNELKNTKSCLKSYSDLKLDKRYLYFKEMKNKICK
jgi:hypothetical protein